MARGKITARQRIFVDAFLGVSRGNATDAARRAGCKVGAKVQASRWLTKPNVQKAIAERQAKRELRSILTNDEIDQRLSSIADDELEDTRNKIAAMRELDKCRGRHSVNINLKATVTIAERLGALRKRALERQAARQQAAKPSKGARA